MTRGGLYQLLIVLDKPIAIQVGRLGLYGFPGGHYVYTGSAMRGLDSRIARHLSRRKRFHWHIDYLLEHARILRYAIWESEAPLFLPPAGGSEKGVRRECELARATLAMEGASVPAVGFGSSDCHCVSHLVHFRAEPRRLPVEISGELAAHGRKPL